MSRDLRQRFLQIVSTAGAATLIVSAASPVLLTSCETTKGERGERENALPEEPRDTSNTASANNTTRENNDSFGTTTWQADSSTNGQTNTVVVENLDATTGTSTSTSTSTDTTSTETPEAPVTDGASKPYARVDPKTLGCDKRRPLRPGERRMMGPCCRSIECYASEDGTCVDPSARGANLNQKLGLSLGSGRCGCGRAEGPWAAADARSHSKNKKLKGDCCYTVRTRGCTGRPLMIEGLALVAPLIERADWV